MSQLWSKKCCPNQFDFHFSSEVWLYLCQISTTHEWIMPKMEELQKDRALLQKRRNLPCVLCEKSFSHKYYLNNHMKLEHEDNPENGICDQCDETFKNCHQLARHRYHRHITKKKTRKCDKTRVLLCKRLSGGILSPALVVVCFSGLSCAVLACTGLYLSVVGCT